MPSELEQEIVLARFDGTNILLDSAYIGPTYLRRSQNYIPGDTFRLETRPGTTTHPGGLLPGGVTRIHALFASDYNGNRYLYAVARNAGVDTLYVSVNDAAWVALTPNTNAGGLFASQSENYGFERIHEIVYVSNGIDNVKKIDTTASPTVAADLVAVASFTDGSAAPTVGNDTGASILTGTYSYAWVIFDNTLGIFVERGQTRTVDKVAAADQSISFPSPTGFASNAGVLSARYQGHLFVAPVNWPVELAHDQNPGGAQAAGAVVLRQIVADGPPLPLRNAVRRGQCLRAYYDRLILGADTTATSAVWCTHTLLPGQEQAIFNTGEFFPANGKLPRTPGAVTMVALASAGERGSDVVQGILIVGELSRTFFYTGDIIDDPSADFQQIAAHAGAIGVKAYTESPFGVFAIGAETVWCFPPDGSGPVDVGWPIKPAILEIPSGQRSRCLAWYHKHYLKIAIVPAGQTTAVNQWWLDLRRGLTAIPSWWGPHVGVAPSAVAVSQVEPAENDRAWHAIEGTNRVEIIHQVGKFTENNGTVPIVGVIQTGELNNGKPFQRKLFTRVLAIGKVGAMTSVPLSMLLDGTIPVGMDPLDFDAPQQAVWNATWNASWGQQEYTEGESVCPEDRPRARSVSLQLTHSDPVGLGIRELVVRYIPSPREVRSDPADASS